MNVFYEFFENILGIFNTNYSIVFQEFYSSGGYNNLFLVLFGIPLVFLLVFYFIWKYPYGTLLHWIIFVGIITFTVAGLTYSSVRLDLANYVINPDPDIEDFTNALVVKYVILNAALTILVSLIYSLGLKRFSKVQMHLPF
jgi:hypothetical protein